MFDEKSSYNFSPEIFVSQNSYEQEVKVLIEKFIDLNHEVYIRDVSYLGFPSFYVYIPHISLFGRKTYLDDSNTKTLIENVFQDSIEDVFFPTSSLLQNKERIKDLLNIIAPNRSDEYQNIKMQEFLRLDFNKDSYWTEIPINFFLTMFCFIVEEFSNAKMYLKSFMKETNNESDSYYLSILRYFECLIENLPSNRILDIVPQEVISSFSSVENMFSDIELPNCPNCKECKLSNSCKTKPNFILAMRIAQKMKEHEFINQEYLKQFIN